MRSSRYSNLFCTVCFVFGIFFIDSAQTKPLFGFLKNLFTVQNGEEEYSEFDSASRRCSKLYERCQFYDCCGQLECTIVKRVNMESYHFFCGDPSVNDSANIEGLNNWMVFHPNAYPPDENIYV